MQGERNEIYEQLIKYITDNQGDFYRLALSYTKNSENALDVVQNAIYTALVKYNTIKNPKFFKTWFYRILINESLMYLRKQREIPSEINTDSLTKEDKYFEEDSELFWKVESLPEKIRVVIILRFYEEMSLKEISKITNVNLSTVKSRLYKGLRDLKILIDKEEM